MSVTEDTHIAEAQYCSIYILSEYINVQESVLSLFEVTYWRSHCMLWPIGISR